MPTLWKSANITPIHKGASWELVTNYRSISLLPISAKCLESIVHCAIYDHVSPFLTEWQHGFIKGRSCETQLILTHHQWATALDKGRQVDVVFLDFSKAFDKVNHAVLLQMLCNFGITGSLLQWCESYLSNRRQKVVLDGISSSWSDASSGVPQGSLLGPLFFIFTPFTVHYEKIRHHLRETATNTAKIHSLAQKYEHLGVTQIQLRFLHFNQNSITFLGIHMRH